MQLNVNPIPIVRTTRRATMKIASIHARTGQHNVAEMPNVWHKIIVLIAFVRQAHKEIH